MSLLLFDLQLREGRACLGVPGATGQGAAAPSAAKQALALEPYLPVLAALEAWLGQPWQRIAPAAEPEGPHRWPGEALALCVHLQPTTGGAAAHLALPWACLPTQPTLRPWPTLPGFAVQWPVAAVQWVLDRIDEGLLPAQPPAVGDLVLLPSTFVADKPSVSIGALVLDGPAALWPELTGAAWGAQQASVDLHGAAPSLAESDPGAWQICTAPSPLLQLSLGCWWSVLPPPQSLPPLRAQNLPVQLHRPQRVVRAAGSLVCVGQGWALRVEHAQQHRDNDVGRDSAPRSAA